MMKLWSKKLLSLYKPIEPFTQLFTANGSFKVPVNCFELKVTCIGRGGNGGFGSGNTSIGFWGGGGGGSGAKVIKTYTGAELQSIKLLEIPIVFSSATIFQTPLNPPTAGNGGRGAGGGGAGGAGGIATNGDENYNGTNGTGGGLGKEGKGATGWVLNDVTYGSGGNGGWPLGGGGSGTAGCLYIEVR